MLYNGKCIFISNHCCKFVLINKQSVKEKSKINNQYLLFISLIAGMGGYLFGYDWVVIGGAKAFYEIYFSIENISWLQGWVMSSALLGCIIGVVISGNMSDKYGRKMMMLIAAFIFTFSAIGTGAANTINGFILFRILSGVGIGIASNISPIYLSEVSPPETRGKFVAIYQLAIVLGILSAQLINWLIAKPIIPGENILLSWNGQLGWRWMFWAPQFLQ